MFKCIDGLQGSGKSYYATAKILEKKGDYFKVLTNIDSFKFKDNIEFLDFEKLKNVLDDCKSLYDSGEDDAALKKILIEKEYISLDKPLLLVIDEAHNFFDRKDELLTWFITYHRHLYIDVYLVTQTYSLIHYSYHKLIQEYIHALPQDRQIFGGKFKYQKHIAVPYNKQFTQAGNEYLKLDRNIFSMYQSGDKVRSKSVVRKYLYYVIGLIAFGILAFYYMVDYFFMPSSNSVEPVRASISKVVSDLNSSASSASEYADLRYLRITCVSKYCFSSDTTHDISFNLSLIESLVAESDSKIVSVERKFKNTSVIIIMASDVFFNFFRKENVDEKNNNTIKLF